MNDVTLRGIGLLSALGADAEETLAALREGESAIFPDADGNPCGAIQNIDTQRWLGGPPGLVDRASLLMLVASAQALHGVPLPPPSPVGVMAGTVWGGVQSASLFYRDAVEKGPRLVKPMLFPHTYGNTGASLVAMRWNLSGPHGCEMTGRAASGHAFAEAVATLRAGHDGAMLVVGAESLSPQRRAALESTHPGLILGEAGAACLLERGAAGQRILSARCGNGVAPTLRAALAEAGVAPTELSLVVTSVCGRPDTDEREAAGLREVLGAAQPPVLAPLGLCGELEGANAVFLVAVASLCLCHGVATTFSPDGRGNALILATDPPDTSFACVIGK